MGEGPPPRTRMPEGWNLVVHGPRDHQLLHLEEVDKEGEGITARTSHLELLNTVAADTRLDYVELYHGSRQRRHQVKLELLADAGPGWFRAVHYDESTREFDRRISATRGKKTWYFRAAQITRPSTIQHFRFDAETIQVHLRWRYSSQLIG
ncbi:hypothetical protein [Mesorhizobium sp. M0243]|uniref:hypothetical protein n=1 Tax=Mesorhizobium sp. M0243 TaxID=2956925 RepID=UPI003338787C